MNELNIRDEKDSLEVCFKSELIRELDLRFKTYTKEISDLILTDNVSERLDSIVNKINLIKKYHDIIQQIDILDILEKVDSIEL